MVLDIWMRVKRIFHLFHCFIVLSAMKHYWKIYIHNNIQHDLHFHALWLTMNGTQWYITLIYETHVHTIHVIFCIIWWYNVYSVPCIWDRAPEIMFANTILFISCGNRIGDQNSTTYKHINLCLMVTSEWMEGWIKPNRTKPNRWSNAEKILWICILHTVHWCRNQERNNERTENEKKHIVVNCEQFCYLIARIDNKQQHQHRKKYKI